MLSYSKGFGGGGLERCEALKGSRCNCCRFAPAVREVFGFEGGKWGDRGSFMVYFVFYVCRLTCAKTHTLTDDKNVPKQGNNC